MTRDSRECWAWGGTGERERSPDDRRTSDRTSFVFAIQLSWSVKISSRIKNALIRNQDVTALGGVRFELFDVSVGYSLELLNVGT